MYAKEYVKLLKECQNIEDRYEAELRKNREKIEVFRKICEHEWRLAKECDGAVYDKWVCNRCDANSYIDPETKPIHVITTADKKLSVVALDEKYPNGWVKQA